VAHLGWAATTNDDTQDMYGDSGVYRFATRTYQLPAIVRPIHATGGGLTACHAEWPKLWLRFARLLSRSSAEPMAAPTGHRTTSPGPALSQANARMMSRMSEVVAGVSPVVTGVPTVVPGVSAALSGVPAVVPDVPAVLPDIPRSWEALPPGRDALQQVLDEVTDRNRAVYDALANEYDKKAPKHFTTTHYRVDRVAKYVPDGGEILDVGCGVGLALSILGKRKEKEKKEFRATGIDISPRMAELARERSPRTPVVVGDFLTADLPATYDAIWEQAVLHLFPSLAEGVIFERFRALLKPGGILSLSTTVSESSQESWKPKTDYGLALVRYRRSITEAELAEAFIRYGFGFVDRWETTDPFGKTWRTVVGRKQ
jgi:SAM-dependent methyltransferase